MGHPSPRLLRSALAVALILDISLPLTLGVVPGPACVNCSWPAIASAWPATPQGKSSRDRFFVGESCFDLLALALLRALTLAACLAALLHRRTSARAPALEPLRAPPLLPPRPAPLFVRYAGRACALAALLYSAAKGFTRLLQSGEGHGVGFGLLVHAGTTPPALEFWLCLTGAALLAEAEARAYEGLILAAGAGRAQVGDALEARSGDLMNKKGTRTADAAAEAANAVKEAYCKRTAPAAAEVQAMRYCFRLMRRDWKLLLLAYVSLVLAAAGESSVPLLYGKVIDAIAIHPDLGAFHLNILLLLGVALFTGIFTGLRGSTFLLIGGRFSKRLRQELFDALLQQELDFFGATKTGDVTSRLSADCQKVGDQVTLNVNVFLRSVIQVCFTLGFMVVINWRLAATCFVVVPAIVWASKVFGEFYRALSTETQDALAEANSTAEEVISSISTTHAFAAEKEESCRYADGMSTYLQCVKRQAKLYFFYSSATFTFLPYSTYCLVLFYGAQLINTPEGCSNQGSDSPTHVANCSFSPSPPPALAPRCELDSPGLVSFVFYMQSLFSAFQQLGSIYTALAQAAGAADKVCTWIKRKPALPHAAPLVEPTVCRGELRLDDVSFRYSLRPDRLILDHLSFCAKPGEVIALCGPSGGGKSSIIALIARFYDPEAGRVLLDGVPVRQLSPQWFYGQVALVGQEPVLYARSIADNICYGLQDSARPDFSAVVAAASLANADSFICGFEHGYETMIGERGTQLSGGQKQRVAIARALVRKPAVLLLDEATSALDADSEAVVQEAIDQMIAQGGMTVLVIAHRLSTIRGADCILVIKDGRVCEQGTNAQLLESKGEYSKLVQKQMHVHQPMAPTTPSASRHCFPIG